MRYYANGSRKQAGDTIIEVLIAIAIVSLVLAGAYSSTNHNVATTHDTQEHAQALQLVQSQVEFLRTAVVEHQALPSSGSCFVGSTGLKAITLSDCKVTAAGVNCPVGLEPCYTLSINGPSGAVYAASATWTSLISSQAKVTLYYRP